MRGKVGIIRLHGWLRHAPDRLRREIRVIVLTGGGDGRRRHRVGLGAARLGQDLGIILMIRGELCGGVFGGSLDGVLVGRLTVRAFAGPAHPLLEVGPRLLEPGGVDEGV